MQDLIARVVERTGLDAGKAERAVGIVLHLVKTQGNPAKIAGLFAKLPGAEALAALHGSDGARGGGLLGILGGGLMGGPLAAISKLQAAGLDMEQIRVLGSETLGYAKEKAGDELVRDAAGSIPGLSAYI
jgi:hypothetical protein